MTAYGLITIAKQCQDLQVLELDRAIPITKKIVEAMTYVGLKNLEFIELNQTKISAQVKPRTHVLKCLFINAYTYFSKTCKCHVHYDVRTSM